MSNGNSEEMMSQLIQMVGALNRSFNEMKMDIQELKTEVGVMKEDIQGIKIEMAGMKEDIQGLKIDVASLKEDNQSIKEEVKEIKKDLQEVKERQLQFELKNEDRHEELLRTINSMKADQDYIFMKTVRNEREIEKLKKH